MGTRKTGIPGIKRYFEPKTGKWYCYHRRTGKRIEAEFGTQAFVAEVARLDAEAAPAPAARVLIPRTLGELIIVYRAASFENLAPRTRKDYQAVFDYLRPLADLTLESFTPGGVVKLRDKAFAQRRRRFANYVVAVLSILFEFAREREYVAQNPVIRTVKKIRRPRTMPDANRPWTMTELREVLAAAPIHLLVPIALCAFIGIREGDALAMPRDRYNGQEIATITAKAGVYIWWRCPAPLKAVLDAAPRGRSSHLALTSRGQPWTQSGFRASWRTFRQGLEKKGRIGTGLTIHGLRHTVATFLREDGFDPRTIADALGQKTDAMAVHYSRRADLKRRMEAVSDAIERRHENEQGTKVV